MNWSYWKVIKKQTWLVLIFLLLIITIGCVSWNIINNEDVENTHSLYISLLSLIASGITSVVALILPILRKPNLELKIEEQPHFSKSQDQNPSSWFHRLYVINYGLQPAENCIGKLIEIRDENGKRITKFDPTPFSWTHQNKNNEFKPVSIFGRGDYAVLDILQEKVVSKSDECQDFNQMKDWDRNQVHESFSKDYISATENQLPLLRLHLPLPESFPNHELNSVSPGTKPILIPGTYYLLIGIYAKNGLAKPEWYKLDIELSSQAEIGNKQAMSKSTLKKASPAEKRSLK